MKALTVNGPIKLLKLLAFALCACTPQTKSTKPSMKPSYLALGDSYTIGEGVSENTRWPVILATERGWQTPDIIARTGWRSDQLLEEARGVDRSYDYISILIGVNDQFQSEPVETFRKNLVALIAIAKNRAKTEVFVVTIPDYGATPFGKKRDPDKIRREIDQFNRVVVEESESANIRVFDITPVSRELTDKSHVTSDGLHPSGKMYREWVNVILAGR